MAPPSGESLLNAEFDALVKEQLELWKVPGLTIAIVHGANTYSKAYGFAELPDKKMTTDALFSTCSTTKAFTAAATSMAIQDSKATASPFDWDTPMSALIPEDFVLADDYYTKNVTIEDLLSHRSGMAPYMWVPTCNKKDVTVRETVRSLRNLPLSQPLRTKFQYNNHGYIAVSHALEKLTGEPLGKALKSRIWEPLGMNETYFSIQEAKASPSSAQKFVQGYSWHQTDEGGSYNPEPAMSWDAVTGAGSMVSNVLDYSYWIREQIHKTGPLKGHDSLTQPRVLHFESGGINPPGPWHAYALGWFCDYYRDQPFYTHAGGWPGFGSLVGFLPNKVFGFAIMGNATSVQNVAFALLVHLLDKILNLPDDPKHNKELAACFAKQREEWDRMVSPPSLDDVKAKFYPSLPDPPLPLSLAVEKYAGTYTHKAGGSVTLTAQEGCLTADFSDRPIAVRLDLVHVSGEFFIGKLWNPRNIHFEQFPVEFSVGSTGTAHKIGMLLEAALGGEKIWFERKE
ncbi:Peptidase S12 Pab87-related C-terminal [Penicillium riverlandense]|uniref:Peptidase S12 Pab87-related C-terminal n=1 Tax=Penicillium riverlandense TaxID=1903569 RepID=UPI00254712A5|nr:Peptidase S12 Pab87-related C-terminal [Penicillium riverlandense]KAJ5820097.1 Peptidase S12 Pab87-related C-terminal [Penicillium riverlandense]